MEINKDKYRVYFFNTPKVTSRNILRILEFTEGHLPSKYLGAPLVESSTCQISWKDLLNKIKCNLDQWTFKALNFPSHLILVKSVLQAMPLYLLSIMAAPKSVLKQI